MTTPTLPMMEALPPARTPSADVIAEAMACELSLIEDLLSLMRLQREAVAANDIQTLDDTVFATHRVLATLAESRRQRRALNSMLGERDGLPLDSLDEVLGERMTDAIRAIRTSLVNAASTLSRDVAINRHILRQALASGDAYLRTLAGAPAPATYAPRLDAGSDARGITVLNCRA